VNEAAKVKSSAQIKVSLSEEEIIFFARWINNPPCYFVTVIESEAAPANRLLLS